MTGSTPSPVLLLRGVAVMYWCLSSAGTVKVKSSNIQVGDLIIVEKVSLYVSIFFVKYISCKTFENEIF